MKGKLFLENAAEFRVYSEDLLIQRKIEKNLIESDGGRAFQGVIS